MTKKRLDILLVEKGLAPTRAKAAALILAGQVLVNDAPVEKAGQGVAGDAAIRLRETLPYVGRGGLKLAKALDVFGIDPKGLVCLDVGQSTGGFTDCLLQRGARCVYGVDSGRDQLDWKLRTDARVRAFESANFRRFDLSLIPEPVGLAVMDVSFISAKLLLPKIAELFRRDPGRHALVVLVKPQFEAGREHVGKGGIVRDAAVREKALGDVVAFTRGLGFADVRTTESPITGADGNVEFLLGADWPTEGEE